MSGRRAAFVLLLALASQAAAHEAPDNKRLPMMGPAPDFTLVSQDGTQVSMSDFRGKVVAVAFIFATCLDICPMLTDNMVRVQHSLDEDFGRNIAFVSITVDPERDTPEILKVYAESFGADLRGWSFLTGDPEAVHAVGLKFGVIARKTADGDVDHLLLTSLIDADGQMRVQYLGAEFNLEEFRGDLLSLVDEAR